MSVRYFALETAAPLCFPSAGRKEGYLPWTPKGYLTLSPHPGSVHMGAPKHLVLDEDSAGFGGWEQGGEVP